MTIRVPFYVVDVFASQPLTGSPLPLLPDADGLDEAQLRAIARELSRPGTTFAAPVAARGHGADTELHPGQRRSRRDGHNALGAWVWLRSRRPPHGPGPQAGAWPRNSAAGCCRSRWSAGPGSPP